MKDTDKSVDGQSFYAEHLTGSGTILPDGTYGEPRPDPTVLRGGPAGERTTSGGVERPRPAEVPEYAELNSAEKPAIAGTSQASKARNSASK
jgi:hypothetical protein